jgi:hypothetical protein
MSARALIRRIRQRCEIIRGGCWIWQGAKDEAGYGQIRFRGRLRSPHRLMAIAVGILPEDAPRDLFACHTCDTPPCCRPDHLFAGTNADNQRDAARKGRLSSGERVASAKLTTEQARAIRRDPRLHRLIAVEYGIDPSTVSHIKSGRRWSHV